VMGMAETSWEQYKADIHALLGSTLEWMIRTPRVLASQWPDGQRAVAFLALNLPADATLSGSQLRDELRMRADSGSLFYPVQRGTVDADWPGWDKGYWLTNPEQVPSAVLGMSGSGAGSRFAGLHVPSALNIRSFDQAVFDAGGRYRLGGSDQYTFMPSFAAVSGQKPDKRLVLLPKGSDQNASWMALALGGVGVFNTDDVQEAKPTWGALLRQPPSTIWVGNAEKIANWWMDRERLQLKARYLGSRAEVDVSVIGRTHFDGASILVLLPTKGRLPILKGLKSGMPTPVVSLMDDHRALIRFDRLAPGNYSYQLTY